MKETDNEKKEKRKLEMKKIYSRDEIGISFYVYCYVKW